MGGARSCFLILAALVALGCGEDAGPGNPASGSAGDSAALIKRGSAVYNTNCIACHHRDPSQEGGLGPPIAGSSRELVEARVLRAEYPPGYTPRNDTKLMIPLPHLDKDIDAIVAFLSQ